MTFEFTLKPIRLFHPIYHPTYFELESF